MTDAFRKVQAARTALVLDQPFWGSLALRLKVVEDPTCKTAWVDGVTLGYSPTFIESLTHAETVGTLAHEVSHCALGHPWRRAGRDLKRWNVACDHAINPMLAASGFLLPEGGLLDPANDGKTAEWIYDRLPVGPPEGDGAGVEDDATGPEEPDGQAGGEKGEGRAPTTGVGAAAGPCEAPGEVRDAPADVPEGQTEADWQQAVQQAAAAARQRGNLPGAAERFARDAARPRVDWRSVLRRFVTAAARADYSWMRPSGRYLARGLYLPALRSEQVRPIIVAVDTSGSVDDVTLAQFTAEITAIAEDVQPERVVVIYADAVVQGVEEFEPGDPIKLTPRGGGGTRFEPVFDAVRERYDDPACVIYLTDLAGSFPDAEPDVPVLWAVTGKRRAAPFGEVVPIE
jgi:predicted metal-dependent peptidase